MSQHHKYRHSPGEPYSDHRQASEKLTSWRKTHTGVDARRRAKSTIRDICTSNRDCLSELKAGIFIRRRGWAIT